MSSSRIAGTTTGGDAARRKRDLLIGLSVSAVVAGLAGVVVAGVMLTRKKTTSPPPPTHQPGSNKSSSTHHQPGSTKPSTIAPSTRKPGSTTKPAEPTVPVVTSVPGIPNLASSVGLPLSALKSAMWNLKLVGSPKSVNISGTTLVPSNDAQRAIGGWVWTPAEFPTLDTASLGAPAQSAVQTGTLGIHVAGKLVFVNPPAAAGKSVTLSTTASPVALVSPTGPRGSAIRIAFPAMPDHSSPGSWLYVDSDGVKTVASAGSSTALSIMSLYTNVSPQYKDHAGSSDLSGTPVTVDSILNKGPWTLNNVQFRLPGDAGAAWGATAETLAVSRSGSKSVDSFSVTKTVIPAIDVALVGGYEKTRPTYAMLLNATFGAPVVLGGKTVSSGSKNAVNFVFVATLEGTTGYIGLAQPQSAFRVGSPVPPLGWLTVSKSGSASLVPTMGAATALSIVPNK